MPCRILDARRCRRDRIKRTIRDSHVVPTIFRSSAIMACWRKHRNLLYLLVGQCLMRILEIIVDGRLDEYSSIAFAHYPLFFAKIADWSHSIRFGYQPDCCMRWLLFPQIPLMSLKIVVRDHYLRSHKLRSEKPRDLLRPLCSTQYSSDASTSVHKARPSHPVGNTLFYTSWPLSR